MGGNTLVKAAALVNFAAGSIGVGISAYEVVNSLDNADYDAALAHSVALAGGMVFLSSPLLATCLAIPGWGWATLGMGLILGGGVWAAFATDGPLEKHLKLGPLGISPDASEVPDTDNDYYPQLLSLMSPFHVSACRLSDISEEDKSTQEWINNSEYNPDDILITLTSPLTSQFPSWKTDGITIMAQEIKYGSLSYLDGRKVSVLSDKTKFTELKRSRFIPSDNSIKFVVGKTLSSKTETNDHYSIEHQVKIRLCIQVKIKTELGYCVLPYALQNQDLPFNPDTHSSAPPKKHNLNNIKEVNQAPFWFIEEVEI